ncbi:MAG: 2-amino-4-hydroxy-6-hydroxymethyldihydropteridine diphosphokinase, partial [Bacteroidetes bacterium]
NQALEVNTVLEPHEVLDEIQKIENQMGRIRYKKWGRRLIDIDILFYEKRIIKTPKLAIPHPFLQDRNFVLAPLNELIPDFIHPVFKSQISQIFQESQDELKAEIYISDKKSKDLPFKEI